MSRIGSTLWGALLISMGAYFLVAQLGGVHLPHLGAFWPLFLVLMGVIRLVESRFASGVALVIMGAAFLAGSIGWLGFTYGTIWPLLLVAVGAGMVVRAFMGCGPRLWTGGWVRHD